MSSESGDDDDFLSADEGEGQEPQIKNEMTPKSLQRKAKSDNEIKEKRDDADNLVSKNIENPIQNENENYVKPESSISGPNVEEHSLSGTSVEKLSIQLDECEIEESKNEKLSKSNTDKLTKNLDNISEMENLYHSVSLDSKSTQIESQFSNTETGKLSAESVIELDTASEVIREGESDKATSSLDKKTETHAGTSRTRPIREAKIRLKKPREKLGERLGSKKIGSRITKPLVGISSDSICDQNVKSKEFESSTGSTTSDDWTMLSDVKSTESNEDAKDDDLSGWGSWGDWTYSLANAATSISREVSRGVGTVLETVESSIGAPDAEELAKEMMEREKELLKLKSEDISEEYQEPAQNEETGLPSYTFGLSTLGTLVSGVSGALETASNKVLLGGLDTLEKIGRKTMDIIQEGDPGLRRKRAFLKSNKPNLSTVLLEAKERAIAEEEFRSTYASDEANSDKKKSVSMALIWDNTEGPARSEALSLVAKQSQGKIASLMNEIASVYRTELQVKLADIKNCGCLNEEDKTENIPSRLMEITRDVQLPLQFSKVLTGWPSLQKFLSRLSIEICGLNTDYEDIQRDLYKEVANYVSQVVGVFQKAAELALVTPNLNCVQIAQQFQRLYGCISGGLEKFADDVCESISSGFHASDPDFSGTITNIYWQMATLNSYMEDSLLDLNTVFQYAQIKVTYDELL